MGLKPDEFIKISERKYVLLLISYLRKENKELRHLRKICWTITCSYADPKQLPANEIMWWRLPGEPKFRLMNAKETKKVADKFRSTKWTLSYPLKSEYPSIKP